MRNNHILFWVISPIVDLRHLLCYVVIITSLPLAVVPVWQSAG